VTKKEFYEFVLEAYRPAEALMRMTPADKLDWRPESNFMSLGQVICHLSEGITQELQCLTTGQWPSPEQMAELMKLENIPACTVEEALQKLEADKSALGAFLDSLSEEDFSQKAVSTPWGMQGKMERMSLTFLHQSQDAALHLPETAGAAGEHRDTVLR
jgi:hypothetical protein